LNFALKNELNFKKLSVDTLPEAYELIKKAREDKNYPVTMSLEGLQNTFLRFPYNYNLFGVYSDNRLVSASVCIKVSNEIMYNFYVGDDLNYRKHSPVVYLLAELFNWCKHKGYNILDLGISTDKGVLNKGLFNFKANLGAQHSEKPTYAMGFD